MDIVRDVGLGNLITLGLAFLGGFASWITLKGKVAEVEERCKIAVAKAEAAAVALGDFRLQAAREYVPVTALRELKEDLSKEIKEVEHIIRNYLFKGQGRAGG